MILLYPLFRVLSFIGRVVSAFIFVVLLQAQWDGKTIEHYLVRAGKDLVVTKFLRQASQENTKSLRKLAHTKPANALHRFSQRPFFQNIRKRFSLPEDMQVDMQAVQEPHYLRESLGASPPPPLPPPPPPPPPFSPIDPGKR